MSVQTYDPKAVVITFGGVPIVGYADGEFVSVERDEDAFSKNVGADGTVARAKSNNRSGAVTVTLQQTSLSNDYLSGVANADELTGNGVLPLMIKDINGTSLFFAASAWVRKQATAGHSKEISEREWIIDCADITIQVGGVAPSGVL